MRFTRTMASFSAAAMSLAVACSDSGPSQPDLGTEALLGVSATDTSTSHDTSTTRPDTAITHPDTAGHPLGSTDPRALVGTVRGMGPASDTSKYEAIAGATIVLSAPDDSTAGTAGQQLARTTSGSTGDFSLGSFKPGVYMITVTPPAGSPFKAAHWGFLITVYSAPTMNLGVWLGRQ